MAKYYMQTADGMVFTTDHPEYHKDDKKLTAKAGKEAYRGQAEESLRKLLQPGSKVYTKVEAVSSSGMSRRISAYICEGGDIRCINHWVATVIDEKESDKGGITIGGCGMDMGFHMVYTLGRYLFPDGFKVEGRGRNGDTSGWDRDGGYALKQEWM